MTSTGGNWFAAGGAGVGAAALGAVVPGAVVLGVVVGGGVVLGVVVLGVVPPPAGPAAALAVPPCRPLRARMIFPSRDATDWTWETALYAFGTFSRFLLDL